MNTPHKDKPAAFALDGVFLEVKVKWNGTSGISHRPVRGTNKSEAATKNRVFIAPAMENLLLSPQ